MRHCQFVFASTGCSTFSLTGDVICYHYEALSRDLRKMPDKRAEFRDLSAGIGQSTNHGYILSTPTVAMVYLFFKAENRKRLIAQIRYKKRYM